MAGDRLTKGKESRTLLFILLKPLHISVASLCLAVCEETLHRNLPSCFCLSTLLCLKDKDRARRDSRLCPELPGGLGMHRTLSGIELILTSASQAFYSPWEESSHLHPTAPTETLAEHSPCCVINEKPLMIFLPRSSLNKLLWELQWQWSRKKAESTALTPHHITEPNIYWLDSL